MNKYIKEAMKVLLINRDDVQMSIKGYISLFYNDGLIKIVSALKSKGVTIADYSAECDVEDPFDNIIGYKLFDDNFNYNWEMFPYIDAMVVYHDESIISKVENMVANPRPISVSSKINM